MRLPPRIIQGGMGVGVSDFHLANVVARAGSLGTVSGVGAEQLVARILLSGDSGGHVRRALSAFPFSDVAGRILERYFVDGGLAEGQKPKKAVPVFTLKPNRELIELTVVSSFVLVWLSKEGHDNPVSVNYLEKIQIPHVYHLFGAMLADVDFVTMGAGLPFKIPEILDAFVSGVAATYNVTVIGHPLGYVTVRFNPREFFGRELPTLRRPGFLPIVSTNILARAMEKNLRGRIQGFVVELPTAGGHNAPPRDKGVFDASGQPLYGSRDEVDWSALLKLGIPFWIGGSFASPLGLQRALALGASGIQVGSIFALSEDSGANARDRAEIRRLGFRGELVVRTDDTSSPTGFPFKVVQLPGTQSDPAVYSSRKRVCNLCLLRQPCFVNGEIVYRCPAEPGRNYFRKGGKPEDTEGARCLCNGLAAYVGIGNPGEAPIITLGDDVSFLRELMADEHDSYTAEDALAYLLRGTLHDAP